MSWNLEELENIVGDVSVRQDEAHREIPFEPTGTGRMQSIRVLSRVK